MPSIVPVATGILQAPQGQVLADLRPEGKPWPGYWEFPGGKIEAGESPAAALVRELREELGIEVRAASPWRVMDFAYSQRTVRLHLFRVINWEGEAHGREGQEIRWLDPEDLASLPFLPANRPIIAGLLAEKLPQPPLCLIADPQRLPSGQLLPALTAAMAGGLRWIVLRLKERPDRTLRTQFLRLSEVAAERGAQVFLNSPEALPELRSHGLHLTQSALEEWGEEGGIPRPFGVSCHDAACLDKAARLGAGYAFLSPLFATATHPDAKPLGVDTFAALAQSSSLPLLALGGITPERVAAARQAGAAGVAVLSGILESQDPAASARAYGAAWMTSSGPLG